jgi:hypothetical protein
MKVCAHLQCDDLSRSRGLCAKHYKELQRRGLPDPQRKKQPKQAVGLQRRCQEGTNDTCVDCGDSPFGGGMRCLECFQRRVNVRLDEEGTHECGKHSQSSTCYRACRCRCGGCRRAVADEKARERRKAAA